MRRSTHLVVLIHGLFGSTSNLEALAEELVAAAAAQTGGDAGAESDSSLDAATRTSELPNGAEETVAPKFTDTSQSGRDSASTRKGRATTESPQVVVYNCNSFGWGHTWDGVDVNAERAAEEVRF
jgi:hypothetical protein